MHHASAVSKAKKNGELSTILSVIIRYTFFSKNQCAILTSVEWLYKPMFLTVNYQNIYVLQSCYRF